MKNACYKKLTNIKKINDYILTNKVTLQGKSLYKICNMIKDDLSIFQQYNSNIGSNESFKFFLSKLLKQHNISLEEFSSVENLHLTKFYKEIEDVIKLNKEKLNNLDLQFYTPNEKYFKFLIKVTYLLAAIEGHTIEYNKKLDFRIENNIKKIFQKYNIEITLDGYRKKLIRSYIQKNIESLRELNFVDVLKLACSNILFINFSNRLYKNYIKNYFESYRNTKKVGNNLTFFSKNQTDCEKNSSFKKICSSDKLINSDYNSQEQNIKIFFSSSYDIANNGKKISNQELEQNNFNEPFDQFENCSNNSLNSEHEKSNYRTNYENLDKDPILQEQNTKMFFLSSYGIANNGKKISNQELEQNNFNKTFDQFENCSNNSLNSEKFTPFSCPLDEMAICSKSDNNDKFEQDDHLEIFFDKFPIDLSSLPHEYDLSCYENDKKLDDCMDMEKEENELADQRNYSVHYNSSIINSQNYLQNNNNKIFFSSYSNLYEDNNRLPKK